MSFWTRQPPMRHRSLVGKHASVSFSQPQSALVNLNQPRSASVSLRSALVALSQPQSASGRPRAKSGPKTFTSASAQNFPHGLRPKSQPKNFRIALSNSLSAKTTPPHVSGLGKNYRAADLTGVVETPGRYIHREPSNLARITERGLLGLHALKQMGLL